MTHKSLMALSISSLMLLAAPAAFADSIVKLSPMADAYGSYTSTYTPNTNTQLANNSDGYTYGDRIPLRGRVTSIPAGTSMMVHLTGPIHSYTSHVGDPVSAVLENDIAYAGGGVAIPRGSEVMGQVVFAEPSGRMGKSGSVDIHFNSIKTPDGTMVPFRGHINTSDQSGVLSGKASRNYRDYNIPRRFVKGVGEAVTGTAIGATSGVALGGLLSAVSVGTGAVLGTAAGGAAGIGYALWHKGKDVIVPAGSRFQVLVDQELSVNPY